MRLQSFLLLMLCLSFCLQAPAASVPAFGDSTGANVSLTPGRPAKENKPGLFGKLKNKLLTLAVKQQLKDGQKATTRVILGWVALGLILLSIGLLFLSVSGTGTGLLFLGGLIAGLIALLLPKTQAEKEQNKKGNKGAFLALGIGVGFIIALLIVFSGAGWH